MATSQLHQQQRVVEEEDVYDMDLTPLLSRDGDVTADWCTMPQKQPVSSVPYQSTNYTRPQFPQRRQSLGVLWQQPSTNYVPPPAPKPTQTSRSNAPSRQLRQHASSVDSQDSEHRLSSISDASAPSMIEDRAGSSASDSDTSFDDGDYHAKSAMNFDSFYQDGSPRPRRVTPPSHRRYGIAPFPPQPEDIAQLPALRKSSEMAQYNARATKRVPVPDNIQILPLPDQQGHARNYSSWPLSATQPSAYPYIASSPQGRQIAITHASKPSYSASTKSSVPSVAASTTSTAPSFSTATTPSSSPLVSPVTPSFGFHQSFTTLRNSTSTMTSNFLSPTTSQAEEKSYWEDSDDEDATPFASFKGKLHIRSPSTDYKKNARRSATSVIKGVFRKEKK